MRKKLIISKKEAIKIVDLVMRDDTTYGDYVEIEVDEKEEYEDDR